MIRYSAVVAVASSTAPGVFDTLIPRTNVMLTNRDNKDSLTLGYTGGDVDLIVTSPIVCDPFDSRLGQGRDYFQIEDPNSASGDVVSVRADNPCVFPSGFEIPQKIGPVWRVHSLGNKRKRLVQSIHRS